MITDPKVQEATKAIAKFMAKEKPYLFTIDKMVTDLNNGEITFTVKVYQGFVTDVVSHGQLKRQVFKRDGSLQSGG